MNIFMIKKKSSSFYLTYKPTYLEQICQEMDRYTGGKQLITAPNVSVLTFFIFHGINMIIKVSSFEFYGASNHQPAVAPFANMV